MKLEDQVCSLELAKRLKELGIKQESIFYWECISEEAYSVKFFPYCIPINHSVFAHYSAFTVAELGEMLPVSLIDKDNDEFCMNLSCIRDFNGDWFVNYAENSENKNEANSRAKALIYLIENNLMEVPK